MPCAEKTPIHAIRAATPQPAWADWPRLDWTGAFRRLWQAVSSMSERHRQRNALSELNNRMLADIGLTRDEAMHECTKWFWQ